MTKHQGHRRPTNLIYGIALVFSWSCTPAPGSYPPPPQVTLPSSPEPSLVPDEGDGLLLAMSDPDVRAHILGDVFPEADGAEWRFTGIHPQFRLQIRTVDKLSFYMRFLLHEQSLRARGPVSFSIVINGNRFKSYRFSLAGDLEYRRPIPDNWITKPGPVDISVDVDPPWRLPDGTTFGILLHSIGFERRPN